MDPNSSPATPPPADDKPDYSSPNDLDSEMSAEEEQAFVNEQLGLGESEEAVKADDGVTPPVVETPKGEEEEATHPAPVAPATEEPETPEPAKPAEIEPVKTDDLWVEVEKLVVDEEGNQSFEKVKLTFDPEDPGSFVPDDFRFKSDKQLADILEAKQEMASLYKERTSEFESKKSSEEAVKTAEQQEADKLAAWDAEVQDLIDAGIMEAPKAKVGDKGFLEDPSVKKIDAVFKYMTAQNDERAKEGKSPIQSFGTAFTMYNNDIETKVAAEAEAKANADAKAKGALVGGSSAASTGTTPSYIAGSASNIWEIPIE